MKLLLDIKIVEFSDYYILFVIFLSCNAKRDFSKTVNILNRSYLLKCIYRLQTSANGSTNSEDILEYQYCRNSLNIDDFIIFSSCDAKHNF